MLSRVADNLYWMSRYLERAEHTARVLDVNLNLMLEQSPDPDGRRWERLLKSLRVASPAGTVSAAYSITQTLTFDPENDASIVACITAARENARQVREQISSEMWEQLNELFLHIKRVKLDDIWHAEPHEFFQAVKEGAHLFQGITDSTMNHGEGWHFIQVGRFIERACVTAMLLDVHFNAFADSPTREIRAGDYMEWVGFLKSCTAFEAYCKVYSADLKPDLIAEFLLLNAEFPRSVRFAAEMMHTGLNAIAETTRTSKSGRANRLTGRFRAALGFGQIDEIIDSGLHAYLEDVQHQCAQIHTAINQIYIAYAIESALAS